MPARNIEVIHAHAADAKSQPRRSKASAVPGDRRLETDDSKRNAKLSQNLNAADAAARCQHIRFNGHRCAAPARSGSDFCIFHGYEYDGRIPTTIPEDAASVQLELGRVIRQLQDGDIQPKAAALILYALQIAAMNLKRLRDELPSDAPVPDGTSPTELVLAELKRILAEEPEPLTTKDTKVHEGA